MKPTFKQFIDSKSQLLEAMNDIPISLIEYNVSTYCHLSALKDNKEKINLRPRYKLIVEWQYLDLYDPTPLSIKVVSPILNETYKSYLSGVKLTRWLAKNTNHQSPINRK